MLHLVIILQQCHTMRMKTSRAITSCKVTAICLEACSIHMCPSIVSLTCSRFPCLDIAVIPVNPLLLNPGQTAALLSPFSYLQLQSLAQKLSAVSVPLTLCLWSWKEGQVRENKKVICRVSGNEAIPGPVQRYSLTAKPRQEQIAKGQRGSYNHLPYSTQEPQDCKLVKRIQNQPLWPLMRKQLKIREITSKTKKQNF